MATVNFSVPDEVKERFNRAFAGQNKSQIIAELMMRAVEEQALKNAAFERSIPCCADVCTPRASRAQIRKARDEGRP